MLSNKIFIKRAVAIHNNKYDYSKVVYKGINHKVEIICSIHGSFFQTPSNHIYKKSGCPKCAVKNRPQNLPFSIEHIIEKATIVHSGKYQYFPNQSILNIKQKINIVCPIHNKFSQKACNHLDGHGCPKCRNVLVANKHRLTTNAFIEKANIVHNNKYQYTNTQYISSREQVELICPTHGTFYQIAYYHLAGNGCQQCADIERSKGLYTECYFKNFPDDKILPGIFYIINIDSNTIKFGITINLKNRYPGLKDKDIIFTKSANLYTCFKIETIILNDPQFKNFKLKELYTNTLQEGWTEMFSYINPKQLKQILQRIDIIINNVDSYTIIK